MGRKKSNCAQPGCTTAASCGFEIKKPLFCGKHKEDGMKNVTAKRCAEDGCDIVQPKFGFEMRKGIYCSSHRKEGMFDVLSPHCVETGCTTQPIFGYDIGNPIRCAEHKQEGMIDVKNKKCRFKGCTRRPSFGTEWKKPLFCEEHCGDLVNVVSPRCLDENCDKLASFGTDWAKPQFCAEHKGDGMENVISKRCEDPGCKTLPTYGTKRNRPRFCSTHAKEGMFITNRLCKHKGCKTSATFGLEDGKATHCSKHKTEQMKDVRHTKCEQDGCDIQPTYAFVGEKPRFCLKHKDEKMVDVRHPQCKNEWCITRPYNPIYRGYCVPCFANMFPKEEVSRYYKTKQRMVTARIMKHLEENYPHLVSRSDRQVDGGCSRKRPDDLIDCLTHTIIIETDEHAHGNEEYCSCENKRMMLLMQDLGMRPIIFLRFNPDGYTNAQGIGIVSPFKRNKNNNQLYVSAKVGWENRLQTLISRFDYHINNVPETEVSIEHLYYNGFH